MKKNREKVYKMKKLKFVLILLLSFYTVENLQAYTTLDGTNSDDHVTLYSETYYVPVSYTFSGETMTILPGAVIKLADGATFNVGSDLVAHGNSSAKIYFTSAGDNTVGEITGSSATNWKQFYANSYAGAGDLSLKYVEFRNGGNGEGVDGTISAIYPGLHLSLETVLLKTLLVQE